MERWKIIAAEMGNRTAVQVQSRVQKYFLKLHRLGLPIPGRLPPQRSKNRYFGAAGKGRKGVGRTTFLATVQPEVVMEEGEEEVGGEEREGGEWSSSEEEDEGLPEEVRSTPEYKELRWLVRVRREKEAELGGGSVEHKGHSCARCSVVRCGVRGILGTRWQCSTCPQVSMCNDCVARGWVAGQHTARHKLR